MFLRAASDFDWQSEIFIIVHGSYSFGLFFFRITTLVISRLTNELDKRNTISCIQSIYINFCYWKKQMVPEFLRNSSRSLMSEVGMKFNRSTNLNFILWIFPVSGSIRNYKRFVVIFLIGVGHTLGDFKSAIEYIFYLPRGRNEVNTTYPLYTTKWHVLLILLIIFSTTK